MSSRDFRVEMRDRLNPHRHETEQLIIMIEILIPFAEAGAKNSTVGRHYIKAAKKYLDRFRPNQEAQPQKEGD